ncbi:PA14 domain-containing protein [Chitinophaga sp. 30R24]|uniref:PA14 domain-containing protein n=1 Tax=Chitinophaga sp. 30R24 TaxID=3248838 RepID=UPI003B8F3F97
MILALVAKRKKLTASIMLSLIYFEMVIPTYAVGKPGGYHYSMPAIVPVTTVLPVSAGIKKQGISPSVDFSERALKADHQEGGPTQPETEAFHSVNSDKMVNLFSGDFSYSIPLIDVGGYPIAIGYNSGITMDQEASWTGLGWNINPGSITRNVRGLPDDFNGKDSIEKTMYVKTNRTIGVDGSFGAKISGTPINFTANVGLFYNNYRGWGMEQGINATIRSGSQSDGPLTASLGISQSSQGGTTINPSLGFSFFSKIKNDDGGFGGSITVGQPFNSRGGMKALQFSAGVQGYQHFEKLTKNLSVNGYASLGISGEVSFVSPTYTPTISMPYTSESYTGKFSLGGELFSLYPNYGLSGYVTSQYIANPDTLQRLPAYGYLNLYSGAVKMNALLDYNREKEIPVQAGNRSIALPYYTYDAFSITGEGTGGMFRGYRNDIGYVFDHPMRTRDKSLSGSVELGAGNLFHAGADFNQTHSYSVNGPWVDDNPLAKNINFTTIDKDYEPVYFRNPGEMAINNSRFYETIGEDDIVVPEITGNQTKHIATTGNLLRYRGGKITDKLPLTATNTRKIDRDKRTQLITYLTAAEAGEVGLSKFIENYKLNQYTLNSCEVSMPDNLENKQGFWGDLYNNRGFAPENQFAGVTFSDINFDFLRDLWARSNPAIFTTGPKEVSLYIRFFSRLKAPLTGKYTINTINNDRFRLYINDSLFMEKWDKDYGYEHHTGTVNLEAGKMYNIKIEYYNGSKDGVFKMDWRCNGMPVSIDNFYLPETIDTLSQGAFSLERRVNDFRKPHHISEIDVLNPDGQKYVYGLPVYNLLQRDATFSVNHEDGNTEEGTANYTPGIDNTTLNRKGNDNYLSKEKMPAYAHTFLLTGIVSPDYVDLTGNGISDDDPGNAVKFNYSKTAGNAYAYKWRTPYSNKVSFNEGVKANFKDDKGSYVYGEKELWYLNSIVSKNMVATFKVSDRADLLPITEGGVKINGSGLPKKLDEINLYTKADFLKYGQKAVPIKTVHFDYTYELCRGINAPVNDSGKLTLKRIWFSYNGNLSKNPDRARQNSYVFYYNSKNPSYNGKSFDRWGNYKDPLQNPGSSRQHLITNPEYPYSLQDSSVMAANAAAWTLDSIKLPSGGRMKINYESDDYAYVQNRRAAQMTPIAGLSKDRPSSLGDLSNSLYSRAPGAIHDYLYVSFNVPKPVTSKQEVYNTYLEGLHDTLFFRLNVQMPIETSRPDNGSEYIPCYAFLDSSDYGFYNNGNTIYVKVKPVELDGDEGWKFSPLANAAIQYLKVNLPFKAYPGSEVGNDLTGEAAIRMLSTLVTSIHGELQGFPANARKRGAARDLDLSRSFARLNEPFYKKYGGGLRVKSILIYDNWNAMTGQKESLYGTVYSYTTTKVINGKPTEISSGVAAYEPILGGEDNPWRTPLIYKEQIGKLIPDVSSYVETPLGESLFPAASVGYSKVRSRSIHTKNTRSANGYEETCFYTAYDFPTFVTASEFDGNTRMNYTPRLGNILKVNAANHLVMSQGFVVELNDMNGKMKSQAVYAEGGAEPISSTTNYYRVADQNSEFKHLDNRVLSINAQGVINNNAIIGLDAELMMDMREQVSKTEGMSYSAGTDGFFAGLLSTTGFGLVFPQNEEKKFRSSSATKVLYRHGILDSVVVTNKGSKVTTRNLLFDSETGSVLLTATQNEFGDAIYQFTYPAAWAYDGMSGAYKNINTTLEHINIKAGKLLNNLSPATVSDYFTSGDEIIMYSRIQVDTAACATELASFPGSSKIWAVDANALNGGTPNIYFMNKDGSPVTGNDITMKVIRSGRRNIGAAIGTVTMMKNPLEKTVNGYSLVIDKHKHIINASMVEYKQNWHVEDAKKSITNCVYQ